MKIGVASDSHGKKVFVEKFLQEKFDLIIFLGDGLKDFEGVQNIKKVAGNCDYFYDEPLQDEIEIEGVKIFFTHGHKYSTKLGRLTLLNYGKKRNANIILYGHTHKALKEEREGVILFNPGALKNGEYGEIDIKKGTFSLSLKSFN